MTLNEFRRAVRIAKDQHSELSLGDDDTFWCFGAPDFRPVCVTVRQVAALIVYQAGLFNGGWDNEALTEVYDLGRKRFIIVD